MVKTAIPTVKVLMTAFPYHLSSKAPLSDAEQLMAEKQIRHLVITREDGGFSLLSERDLQHHRALYGGRISGDLLVGDICADEAICADSDDPIDRVLDAMAEQHLGSVVVLRQGELAGIFTTTDACRHFAEHLRKEHGSSDTPDLIA